MNNLVKEFNSKEFGNVRTIIKDTEAWFIAKDISQILGYKDAYDMTRHHVEECDRETIDVSQNRNFDGIEIPPRGLSIINESGLYSAIFGSKLEKAKIFKKWVTSEVLPSLRKHGAYMTPDTLAQAIANPDFTIGLLQRLKEEQERVKLLQPKAENYDKFLDGSNYQDMNQVAKVVGIGRNKLFAFLREQGILLWNNTPYQRYMEQKYFVLKESIVQRGYDSMNVCTTYVTAKGIEFINKLIKEKGLGNDLA